MKAKHSDGRSIWQGLSRPALLGLLSVMALGLAAPRVWGAQRPGNRDDAQSANTEKEQKPTAAEKDQAKPADQDAKKSKVLAIVGGDVITVTREVIRRGVILVQDGKILDLGQNVKLPDDAEVVDATGRYVTPGFIAMSMSGVGLQGPSDNNAKLEDFLDPFDQNVKLALAVGITSGCAQTSGGRGRFRFGPEERFLGLDPPAEVLQRDALPQWNFDFGDPDTTVCQCCGLPILPTEPIERSRPQPLTPQRHAVVKMSFGSLDGMLVKETAFFHVPSSSLAGALNRDAWREMVRKARTYLQEQAEHEKQTAAGNRSQPPRKPVSDEVIQLVKGEIRLRTDADTQDEVLDMIQLAKELKYELVLDGVTEGWIIPDALGEANVPVVITPRRRRDPQLGRQDATGSSIESSRVFEEAGVPFAVDALSASISLNGIAGRDLTSLPLEAAFAVRGGCSESAALKALTIVPARMLGLEDRLGSIEKGKDADLLILNGPPLDYRTYVETALVNGRVVYQREVDRVLPVFPHP